MLVRNASIADAAQIATIHVRAWQSAYRHLMPSSMLDSLSVTKRQAFWENRLSSGETTVLVAVNENRVTGWLALGPSRDSDAGPSVAEVYGLYVDPTVWRSGTGIALWNQARQRLAQRSIEEATLWVLKANTIARRFYEVVGFRRDVGATKPFVHEGVELEEVRYRVSVHARPGR